MPNESNVPNDWQELTKLTQGRPMVVERVRLAGTDIAIEVSFELPQLARLSLEDASPGLCFPSVTCRPGC